MNLYDGTIVNFKKKAVQMKIGAFRDNYPQCGDALSVHAFPAALSALCSDPIFTIGHLKNRVPQIHNELGQASRVVSFGR